MGYIDDLLQEAQDLLWDEPTPETPADETNAIVHDTFDEMTWKTLNEQAKALQNAHAALAQSFPTAEAVYEDLFNMLHQGDPKIVDRARMRADHSINHQLIQELANSDELQDLRKNTKYDEYNSAFALLGMQEEIRETFVRLEEFRQQQEEAAQQRQQAAQNLQQQMGGTPDPQSLQQAMDALKNAKQGQQQAQQNAQQQVHQQAQQIAQGMQQAQEEIKADEEAFAGYGVDPGQLERMDYEERRLLAERLRRNRMDKLAKLIGSFRSFGAAERRKRAKHAPSESYDYEMSNDLTRLVPEELNNLAIEELEDHFWVRWAQHGLLTRKVRGPARSGQGPILVLCDESGSMRSQLDREGNTREAWSKAVALALCEQARKENRDFTYLGYSSVGQMYEKQWKKGNIPLADIATFVEHFFGGGTVFHGPMERALDIINEAARRDQDKPDVVILSDGDTYLDENWVKSWRKRLNELDAKCFGIQIGSDEGDGAISEVLRAISDRTIHIDRLNATPEGVQELFATI